MDVLRYRDAAGHVGVGVRGDDGVVRAAAASSLSGLLAQPSGGFRDAVERAAGGPAVDVAAVLPPVDGRTEVWASGVTYRRSQEARIEESQVADVYARVYDAPRPELFLKAVAWRVVGDGSPIGIRADSGLDVPEPEIALVIDADGGVVGYTICNDVSSRSIEGENPLYLPQAKIYAGSCALGPVIRPVWELDAADLAISLSVVRSGAEVFGGTTRTSAMHRTFDDLVEHLYRGDHFPDGAVLSTGTGIVPDLGFTLAGGDVVAVTIDGIGTLTNTVVVGKGAFTPGA